MDFYCALKVLFFFAVLSFYGDENEEKNICCRPLRRWREYLVLGLHLKTKIEFPPKK